MFTFLSVVYNFRGSHTSLTRPRRPKHFHGAVRLYHSSSSSGDTFRIVSNLGAASEYFQNKLSPTEKSSANYHWEFSRWGQISCRDCGKNLVVIVHSSEIRGLSSTKCSSDMLQKLCYILCPIRKPTVVSISWNFAFL